MPTARALLLLTLVQTLPPIGMLENVNTYQKNFRIGATVSVPISKDLSLKGSYNNGDYVLYGGNYQSVSAWQYFWSRIPN